MGTNVKQSFKTRLQSKIRSEIEIAKKEISLAEYISWWVMRLAQFAVVIITVLNPNKPEGHYNLQIISNFLMMFILPVIHIFPRKKFFMARLHYRAQTIACLMVVLTCTLGLHFNFYGIYWFDTYIHLIGGIVMVPVGYYVMQTFTKEKISPILGAAAGFGLSLFTAILWEIYEFTFDLLTAATPPTQAWHEVPTEGMRKFLDLFDPAYVNEYLPERHYAILDTMTDLIFGFIGAVLAGVLFRICHEIAKKGSKTKMKVFTSICAVFVIVSSVFVAIEGVKAFKVCINDNNAKMEDMIASVESELENGNIEGARELLGPDDFHYDYRVSPSNWKAYEAKRIELLDRVNAAAAAAPSVQDPTELTSAPDAEVQSEEQSDEA